MGMDRKGRDFGRLVSSLRVRRGTESQAVGRPISKGCCVTDFGLGDDAIRDDELQAALEWHELLTAGDENIPISEAKL